MESGLRNHCGWHDCAGVASKHVRFGLRVHEVAGSVHVSEIPYDAEQFDLCEVHIEHVRNHYFHVKELELGTSPDSSQNANSA